MRLLGKLVCVVILFCHGAGRQTSAQWNLPEDLSLSLIADDELAPDCTNLCCDSQGNTFVTGPGYIARLIDENRDGMYERRLTLVQDLTHGAHGMTVEDDRLYYVANNGVWSIPLVANSEADRAPQLHLAIKTGGEHDAHALRRGPDGCWYLIAGNGTAGMFDLQNVPTPMVPRPRAGAIWKFSSDWAQREVWAHGFRNAYDFDFGPDGSIITFDSDGERDVSLPWYRPTRVYQVRCGDDAGWLSRSWKRPNYDPDMPLVLAQFGRGSPTGVMRYAHKRLPPRFHDGAFVLDWTFGRIYVVNTKDLSTELVVAAEGNTGFAATDIALHPDGRLLVSVGGRGSRGGVYSLDSRQSELSHSDLPNHRVRQDDEELESWQVASRRVRPPRSKAAGWVTNLRARQLETIQPVELQRALSEMRMARSDADWFDSIAFLCEAMGGLGPPRTRDARPVEQQAAVFDGYRTTLAPDFSPALKTQLSEELLARLKQKSASQDVRCEIVRGLAMLEATNSVATEVIVREMQDVKDPVDKLHCLIALARLNAPFKEDSIAAIIAAMLEIPMQAAQLGYKVDSNWNPRLSECMAAFRLRIPELDRRLVEHPNFGSPTHLVWAESLSGMDRQSAARIYLMNIQTTSQRSLAVAEFVASADIDIPRAVIESWLKDDVYRVAGWRVLLRDPKLEDAPALQAAANSFDADLRELASNALGQLGIAVAPKQASEKSIREWLDASGTIQSLSGNHAEGGQLFVARQCAKCHNSSKALGPSLVGITKRFSWDDLLIATVDPSRSISDRYRASQILTESGQLVTGMKIYESVDGITLMTADAQTVRINADEIVRSKLSTQSLMPTGLLDGLTHQQVADLLAYMSRL